MQDDATVKHAVNAMRFFHAVAAVRAFREACGVALQNWRSGLRDALFPAESWLM